MTMKALLITYNQTNLFITLPPSRQRFNFNLRMRLIKNIEILDGEQQSIAHANNQAKQDSFFICVFEIEKRKK